MKLLNLQLTVLRSVSFSMRRSSAYLDPGTGSVILQVILGGIAGAAVAVRMFWHRVVSFIPFRSRETGNQSSTER